MAATSTGRGPLLAARHEQTSTQDSALLGPLDTACPVPRRRSRASMQLVFVVQARYEVWSHRQATRVNKRAWLAPSGSSLMHLDPRSRLVLVLEGGSWRNGEETA